MAFDFKKEYKDLYLPKGGPCLIEVPLMRFIAVKGAGDPNTAPEYQAAVSALYGVAYSIKMSKLSGNTPLGYFDFVVPPLEGLWWSDDNTPFIGTVTGQKDRFKWYALIRQPEFVTSEVLDETCDSLAKKKPELDTSKVELIDFEEGLCAQVMHFGSYDDEPPTIAALEDFVQENGYKTAPAGMRQHHEIYLGDPRKVVPEKLRTVLRHPIMKAG